MEKLVNVWNKENHEKCWKYKGVILAFYDEDIIYPPPRCDTESHSVLVG